MLDDDRYTAEEVARKAMSIAAGIDIYTNGNVMLEVLHESKSDSVEAKEAPSAAKSDKKSKSK